MNWCLLLCCSFCQMKQRIWGQRTEKTWWTQCLLFYLGLCCLRLSTEQSQAFEMNGKVWNKEDLALMEEDQTGESLDKHKPRGPNGVQGVLRGQCQYEVTFSSLGNVRTTLGGKVWKRCHSHLERESRKLQSLILSLGMHALNDPWPVRWTEIRLNCQAQRVVVSSTKSGWNLMTSNAPEVISLN